MVITGEKVMCHDPNHSIRKTAGFIGIALLLTGLSTAARGDVSGYALFRQANFIQYSPTDLADDGWFFSDRVGQTQPEEFDTGTLSYAGPGSPARLTLASPIQLESGSPLFPTKSMLTDAFPPGIYTTTVTNSVSKASQTVTSRYAQDAFPQTVPAFTPATYKDLLGLDASQPFTFQFNRFVTGSVANESYVFLRVANSATGQTAFAANFLPAGTTSIVMPAGSLQANTGYNIELDFSNRVSNVGPSLRIDQGFDLGTSATLYTATLPGDADLDGKVGFADLVILARHYGMINATWTDGDFNRDGIVDFGDLVTLAGNYGRALSGGAPVSSDVSSGNGRAVAQVPEPLVAGVVSAVALIFLLHRHRTGGLGVWIMGAIFTGYGALPAGAKGIALSGFNEDVVTENAPLHSGHRFDRYAPSPADWVETGVSDGIYRAVGLPSTRSFLSATGSGVTYHLRPYNADNVLRLGDDDPSSGTMSVVPGQYSSLHILAASGTGGGTPTGQTSDITLNFAGASFTLRHALLAYDWYLPAGNAPASAVALNGLDRNYLGVNQFTSSAVVIDAFRRQQFALYESKIDLARLGFSGRVLQSVTFNDVDAAHSATGVFAVDGTLTTLLPGDADRDGSVGFDDLVTLARHYGQGNASWEMGDFNNDGTVGFDDLVILAANYGTALAVGQLTALGAMTNRQVPQALGTVPEPLILAPALLAIAASWRTRRCPA